MGKQQAHRRQARQTKEEARQLGGQGLKELNAVKDQFPADPTSTSASAPAPLATSVKPAPTSAPATAEPATKAGKQEYDSFFHVYQLVVQSTIRCPSLTKAMSGEVGGMYFLPLGFIPGPAALIQFKEGQVQVVEATPDVKKGMKIPTPWQKVEELPARMQETLEEWRALVEGLGYEPSPWNAGFARRVLGGQFPSRCLSMMMPQFRYRGGDPELPFGVVLTPVEGGMKLERVHNPQERIPDVPAVGTVLSLTILKDGRGPIQKLLRTWALMETNYWGRYGQNTGQTRPQQRARPALQTRRPTW